MTERLRFALLPLMAASIFCTSIAPAPAKNKAVEFMKYFNPVPEKSYLNQSQDRVIKKKGFKALAVQGAKPVENRELGFFAIIPQAKINDQELLQSLLKRTEVSGLSVLLPWQMLEPKEGETNFKPIDDLLALCKKNNKTLILRVSTCGCDENSRSDTPAWVFEDPSVKSIIYADKNGKEHQMPIFWDSNYLAKWSNLINELGEQYDKNPSLHSVGITGGGIAGSTNVIPDFVVTVKQTIGAQVAEKGKENPKAEESKEQTANQSKSTDNAKASESAKEEKPAAKSETKGAEEKEGNVSSAKTENESSAKTGSEPQRKTEEGVQTTDSPARVSLKSDPRLLAANPDGSSPSEEMGSTAEPKADADSQSKESAESRSESIEDLTSSHSKEEATSEKATAGSAKVKKMQKNDSRENDLAEDKGPNKENRKLITTTLEKNYGMTQRQLIEHWKYVADLFPKAFEVTRLNFDIDPPIRNRKGQNTLDEISDYLVYRYGQRIYLTRQNVKDGHHGFDDYRLLLKFHNDTLTGYQLQQDFNAKEVYKLAKNAAIDGISFCEIPFELINSKDEAVKTALTDMRQHMGYQLVSQAVTLPKDIKVGQKLTASFTFVNLGAAGALRPSRQLDKDVASSYKVQLELRNDKGTPIARLLHTPEVPTNQWFAGKPITWQEELKMPPSLTPGKYDVYLSLLDVDTKRKLRFLNAVGQANPMAGFDAAVGSIQVVR